MVTERSNRPASRHACGGLASALAALLIGCASVAPEVDGPPALPPPDLARVPDAQPRIEPIRLGGPNKPYEVLGRAYVPITSDQPVYETGLASWYGRKFHGRRTAMGEVYDMYAMTAAHPTLPLPSYARVRNPSNGREVVVRVNDRGPFHPGRVIDLSYTAALKLDLLRGVAPVEVERITFDAIRSGAGRREGAATIAAASLSTVDDALAAVPLTGADPASRSLADVGSASFVAPMLEPNAARADDRSAAAPPRGIYLQLGAYARRDTAERRRRELATEVVWLEPTLSVVSDGAVHRVHAGPFASRTDAQQAAQRLRAALPIAPLIDERR